MMINDCDENESDVPEDLQEERERESRHDYFQPDRVQQALRCGGESQSSMTQKYSSEV